MPSSTTMLSAAAPQQTNRQSNLAADNFPSLGDPPSSTGSSNRSTRDYSAARVLSRKNFQRRTVMTAPPPSINSASEFPSIQNSSKTAKKNPQKPLKAFRTMLFKQKPIKHIEKHSKSFKKHSKSILSMQS